MREKKVTNVLTLVKALDTTTPTIRPKHEKPKPRRQRRKEMHNAIKTAKPNQKKVG